MCYDYKIETKQEYLMVIVNGQRRRGHETRDSGEYLKALGDVMKSNGIYKALIVLHVTGRLPATAAYNIVHHPSEFGLSRKIKVAVVDAVEESRLDILFAEEVATNRGYRLKVFEFESDAKKWLLKR